MFNRKISVLLVTLIFTVFTTVVSAEPIPYADFDSSVVPAPQPNTMMNMEFASGGNDCQTVAASYLQDGTKAILTRNVLFNDNQVDITAPNLEALSDTVSDLVNGISNDAHTLSSVVAAFDGTTLEAGTVVDIIGTHVCIELLDGTAMFWQAETPFGNGWLMESIRWVDVEIGHVPNPTPDVIQINPDSEALNYGPVIKVKPKGFVTEQTILAPENLPSIDDYAPLGEADTLVAYFLAPYVISVNPSVGTAPENILSDQIACEGAAPSFLSTNAGAWVQWSYVTDGLSDEEANNKLYGAGNSLRYTTEAFSPFEAPYDNPFYSAWQHGPVLDAAPAIGHQFVNVISGPVCFSHTTTNHASLWDGAEGVDLDFQKTYTSVIVWWQVEALVDGQLQAVWYPESASTYQNDTLGGEYADILQDYWIHRYFMVPDYMVQGELEPTIPLWGSDFVNNDNRRPQPAIKPLDKASPLLQDTLSATTCPAALAFGRGTTVRALYPLNIRDRIGGTVLAVLDAGQTIELVADAEPQDAFMYFRTARGVIAGFDCSTNNYLVTPYTAPAPEQPQVTPDAPPQQPIVVEPMPAVTEEATLAPIIAVPVRPTEEPCNPRVERCP